MVKDPIVIKKIDKRRTSSVEDFLFSKEEISKFSSNKSINEYRTNAYNLYSEIKMPSINDDAWRRTTLKDLHPEKINLSIRDKDKEIPEISTDMIGHNQVDKDLYTLILNTDGGKRIINSIELPDGLVFKSLKDAEIENPDLITKIIGTIVKPEEGKFAAITGAFANNGVLLYVPKNMQIDLTLNSVFWGSDGGVASFNHIMIYLDENSAVTYIHEAHSPLNLKQDSIYGGIIEGYVGKNSKLKFVEIQSLGKNYWNFNHERIRVDQDGEVDWIVGSMGSKLTKSFYDLDLIGEGSIGKMGGFYFLDANQHIDHDTQQNHLSRNTTSDLLFKGVLIDNSRSVWQGMIFVSPEAQKTDGYQANRNLLLSKDARADSIPGLEILADDVRCTHGATVGAIDSDQLFYLKSRGIQEKNAKMLIINGFFDPIIQRVPNDMIRDHILKNIDEKMTF